MAVYQEAVQKAGNVDAAAKAKEINDLIVAACGDGRLIEKQPSTGTKRRL